MEFLCNTTKKALEIQYILNKIDILTPYGRIYKDKIKPYLPGMEKELEEELNKVETYMEYAKNKDFIKEINSIFSHIKDLRQSIRKAKNKGILSQVELFEIKQFLILTNQLERLLKKHNIHPWDDIKITSIPQLEKLLDPEGRATSTFYIYDSYSKDLQKIREDKRGVEKNIKTRKKELRKSIEKELNIKLRPDNTIIISKTNKRIIEKLENHPNLNYVSETYMNIKYSLKITDEISLLERQLLILKEKEEKEELKIREYLSEEIGKYSKQILENMASIGKMDLILGKSKLALKMDATKPRIVDNHIINIKGGRHPIVEENLKTKGLKFTPIDINLKAGISCITGANMGGKTVSLKLVGLLTSMAQYGLLVPAKSMELGLCSFIKTSIGDLQATDQGLSTFGGEIKLISQALEKADEKGLILIDELARGTNPEEGYAISKSIVEYLKDKESITLITTHYDNIGNTKGVVHLQVRGLSHVDFNKLNLEIKESLDHNKINIINKYMDYRLELVDKNTGYVPRDAINIARVMGLKEEIIEMAEENLKGR